MSKTLVIRSSVVIAAAFAAGLGMPSSAKWQQQPSDQLLEQVKASWRKRQDTVSTLRVAWTCKTTTPKGVISQHIRRPDAKGGGVIPATDLVHSGSGELLLDGKNARITMRGTMFDGSKGDFVPYQMTSVFDGKDYTRLLEPESTHPSAFTKAADRNEDGNEMTIAPLLASVRGLDPTLTTRTMYLDDYTTARQVTLGKRRLIELTRP